MSSMPRSKSDAWKKMLADKKWTDLYLAGDDFAKLIEAENARMTEILKTHRPRSVDRWAVTTTAIVRGRPHRSASDLL